MSAKLSSAPATTVSPVPLRRFRLGSIFAMFSISFSRYFLSRKTLTVTLLLTLPIGIAVLSRTFDNDGAQGPGAEQWLIDGENVIVLTLFPHALAPIAALVFAAGLIRDEVEEQTLSYLLLRPLPRWSIYSAKLSAAALITGVLVGLFVVLAFIGLHWDLPSLTADGFSMRVAKTAAATALATIAWCSIFGLVGLLAKRALVLGAAYIFLIEGILANIDFVVRQTTVVYYFRVLTLHWLDRDVRLWNIDLADAPSANHCLLVLIAGSVIATALASIIFSTRREFRLKTPEDAAA